MEPVRQCWRRTAPNGHASNSESGTNLISETELEETMPSLTPEQREAVDLAIGREGYARIDDYVVVKAEVYDRLRAATDDGLDMTQVGSLVESAMRDEDAEIPCWTATRAIGHDPARRCGDRRFPLHGPAGDQAVPGLVVQNDADNARRRKTIVALITGNLKMDGDPSHLLIDPTTPEGAPSRLHGPSLVSCNNLFTIEQSGIIRVIGTLSGPLMAKVNACLTAALGLP